MADLGIDPRYQWRTVLRGPDGVMEDATGATRDRTKALEDYVAMVRQYHRWPKEAVQLERREVGEWEVMDAG